MHLIASPSFEGCCNQAMAAHRRHFIGAFWDNGYDLYYCTDTSELGRWVKREAARLL